jgi:hypothetical protein
VLVQVIHVLDHPALHGSAHRDVVEHREVLDVLAEPDAACVRAHRHVELCGHQHHGEVFVHAAKTAAVDLAEIDGPGLQQLFEHDSVGAVLPGGNANRPHGARDRGMAEDVVRARRLFDPPRIQIRERAHAIDRLPHVPLLIRIDHQLSHRADRVSDQFDAPAIVFGPSANLDLEMRPAVGDRLTAQVSDRVVAVTHPPDRRRVRGIPARQKIALAIRLRWYEAFEDIDRLVRTERVGDVAEVDARHELLRRHVGQQLPERPALGLRVEIPHGVDDRGKRQVDDPLLRSKPSKLRI